MKKNILNKTRIIAKDIDSLFEKVFIKYQIDTLIDWIDIDQDSGWIYIKPMRQHIGYHKIPIKILDNNHEYITYTYKFFVVPLQHNVELLNNFAKYLYEDSVYSYQISIADSSYHSIYLEKILQKNYTIQFKYLPKYFNFDSYNNILTAYPRYNNLGQDSLVFNVAFNDGFIKNFIIKFEVLHTNHIPYLISPLEYTIKQDSMYKIHLKYFDPDTLFKDTVAISLVNSSDWYTLKGDTLILKPTIMNLSINNIPILVYDNKGGFNYQNLRVNVLKKVETKKLLIKTVYKFFENDIVDIPVKVIDTIYFIDVSKLYKRKTFNEVTPEKTSYKLFKISSKDKNKLYNINFNNLPNFLNYSKRSSSLYGIPRDNDVGNYSIKILLYENVLLVDTITIRIYIEDVNNKPVYMGVTNIKNNDTIEVIDKFYIKVKALDDDIKDTIIYYVRLFSSNFDNLYITRDTIIYVDKNLNNGYYFIYSYIISGIDTIYDSKIIKFYLQNKITSIENQILKDYYVDVYPNPFNTTAKINFNVLERSLVSCYLFNVLGEQVAVLFQNEYERGNYSYNINSQDLTSGVYFVKIIIKNSKLYNFTKKIIILK